MIGDPAAAGRGLAREATAALVEDALGRWKLHEVYLEVKDTNAVAIAVYRGCGFESTGNRDGVELMRVVRSSGGE